MCICRLTLACISSEISKKASSNANSSWLAFHDCFFLLTVVDSGQLTHLVCLPHCPWTISRRLVSSAVRCRLSLSVTLPQLPSQGSFVSTAFSGVPLPAALASLRPAFPTPLPVALKISSSGLCLVSRQNKQKGRLLVAPPHNITMAMASYSTTLSAPKQEQQHEMQFTAIPRTPHFVDYYPSAGDTVSSF